MKVKTHVEESLGANPAEAAFDPADSVAMGVPRWLASGRAQVFRALVHREYRLLFFAFLINFFVQSSAFMLTLLVLMLGLFSAFILYDVRRVIDGGEDNYITATLAIYLDLYNVFQSLLSILGIFGGERD